MPIYMRMEYSRQTVGRSPFAKDDYIIMVSYYYYINKFLQVTSHFSEYITKG